MALKSLKQEQRELAEFISAISERSYWAGWMLGIEREVWTAMHAPGFGGAPLNLTAEEVKHAFAMSSKCAGWIVWDEVHEESFIPIEAWIERVNF